MAQKRLADRYKNATTPSSNRIEETVESANKIVSQQEVEKQAKRNKKKAVQVNKVIALLREDLEIVKTRFAPFKNNTTIVMQEDIVKLLGYAHIEFGLNQKELAAIAIIRFLDDLKEDSQLLKTYM